MTILVFSALNFGIGISLGILSILAGLHMLWRLRFNPQQEYTALRWFLFGALFMCINLVASGLLGTLQNYANLETALPFLAFVPLVAKIAAGVSWWGLILWIIFGFYPHAERQE